MEWSMKNILSPFFSYPSLRYLLLLFPQALVFPNFPPDLIHDQTGFANRFTGGGRQQLVCVIPEPQFLQDSKVKVEAIRGKVGRGSR